MKFKRFVSAVAVSAAGLCGVGLAAAPSFAEAEPALVCELRAYKVVDDGSENMHARGGRGDCSNPATVTVMLKRDIAAWPDSIVESSTRTAIYNATWYVYGVGSSGNQYYTQTDSSTGASLQSGRTTLG